MEEQDPDADEYNNQDYSLEEKGGKVSWIVNRGIDVGKKILVTSFLISSAPLVLPPLVVISAIGFAVSVPSGLLIASYACTDKLMSKLLPGPQPSPFLLGYGAEEFEDDEGGEGADSGLVEHIDMEKEQQEELEDMKRTVEMRIDLSEYGDEENGNSGYEEEVDDYVNNKIEGEPSQEVEVKIEGVNREEESLTPLLVDEARAVVVDIGGDERVDKDGEEAEPSFEVSNVVIGLCENDDIEEDEELVKETRGLLEKIRDEGLTNNEEGDQKLDRDAGKMSKPVEDRNGLLRESEPKIEGNKHKTLEESLESQNKGFDREADVIPVEMKTENAIEDLSLARDIDDILQAEISVTEMSGTTEVTIIKEERQKLVEANDNFSDVVGQDVELNRKKNLEIIDDSGFYLFDNKEMSGQRVSDSDYYSAIEEIEQSSCYTSPDAADFAEHPTFAEEQKSSGSRVSQQRDIDAAHNKVEHDSETRIWKQIDAMRKIVGFKAPPKATCFEELKSLYLFTGVEPPASFKDPSDIAEVDDKLRFLMSIIGVKC